MDKFLNNIGSSRSRFVEYVKNHIGTLVIAFTYLSELVKYVIPKRARWQDDAVWISQNLSNPRSIKI